jgi:hypothetical protein
MAKKIVGASSAALAAWVAAMLTLLNDAYALGTVCAGGLTLGVGAAALQPGVALLSDAGALLLAVDVFEPGVAKTRLSALRQAYAATGALEYWQLIARPQPLVHLLQRHGARGFVDTPADSEGMHYALVNEELRFPVAWFAERPMLIDMMADWGLIDTDA